MTQEDGEGWEIKVPCDAITDRIEEKILSGRHLPSS
jgi:hypothetical protein